jgi:glycosyltransferase involved in cell wall biosynthesis
MAATSAPAIDQRLILSICIPTFNRAPYLQCLLRLLSEHLPKFPFPCEVIVADNASTDNTPDVLLEFSHCLPLRCVRHEVNRGAYANTHSALSEGSGAFLLYLADDDIIIFDELASLITRMLEDSRIVAAYAPWILHDLVDDRTIGAFYQQKEDVLVEQDDHARLLDTVLRARAFPEILVARRDAWRALHLRANRYSYWAFVYASNYLTQGAVLLSSKPFYISITRYFDGPPREQQGHDEVEEMWDSYRGGLETVLGRAKPQLSKSAHSEFLRLINEMIAERLAVAIKVRLARNRNPIDTYYLACRLRGLSFENMLPMPMGILELRAAIWFVIHDEHLAPKNRMIVCNEGFSEDIRRFISDLAGDRVRFDIPPYNIHDCMWLAPSDDHLTIEQLAALSEKNVQIVSLRKILALFQK